MRDFSGFCRIYWNDLLNMAEDVQPASAKALTFGIGAHIIIVGFPTVPILYREVFGMEPVTRTYDAKVDSKRRITLRNARFQYYNVREYQDGSILLEPRELAAPFGVSANTLAMMDSAMEGMRQGDVSAPIDLSDF